MSELTKKWMVVLTGGIGSGKSTVAKMFADLGVCCFEADQAVRQLLETDVVRQQLIKRWGRQFVVDEPVQLRKKLMNRLSFYDTDRCWLEKLLHPMVVQQLGRRRQELSGSSGYFLAEVPLFCEMDNPPTTDRVLVVDCSIKLQIKRLRKARPWLGWQQLKRLLVVQCKREQRLAMADDVITNDGELAILQEMVKRLHVNYLRMAQ